LASVRLIHNNFSKCNLISKPCQSIRSCSGKHPFKNEEYNEDEFTPLELYPTRAQRVMRKRYTFKTSPPRTKEMSVKQDWGNVWPGPRSFHPAVVPIPIRQGYPRKPHVPVPDKIANAELMKIPNFLHLTPPIIKRQCEALKRFCTPWPAGLETEEDIQEHYPIEYITSDYVHGLPTIRNPLCRIVSVKFKLSILPLDDHARDKFLRLVEFRHDPNTDIVTFTVDRCPLKQQNFDYAQYLMAALFHESFIVEDWEADKTEADMETYYWYRNKSKETAEGVLNWNADGNESAPKKEADASFATSVENLINEDENENNISKYKEEVLKLLHLKSSRL